MAGGDLPGVPGDRQPPVGRTPGCRGAPFGYFPNLVKYQGDTGASGDTRHLAATTTSPSGWRTCATPCFGSSESTWRLRLRHLPACPMGRAGVFSRPPCCRSHAPAASAWYVAGPEDEIELPGPVSVARLVHQGETACRSNGWKRGFLWMNQLGCADFASACRLCRRGSRQTAHRAGSCSPGWGCSPSAGSAGHRSVTSPPSSRSVRLAVRSFLVERSDPRRVGPGRPPEACGAITMSLARAGDRHVLTCGRSPCAWRSSAAAGPANHSPARREGGLAPAANT